MVGFSQSAAVIRSRSGCREIMLGLERILRDQVQGFQEGPIQHDITRKWIYKQRQSLAGCTGYFKSTSLEKWELFNKPSVGPELNQLCNTLESFP